MDTEAICLGLVITELVFVAVFLQFYLGNQKLLNETLESRLDSVVIVFH